MIFHQALFVIPEYFQPINGMPLGEMQNIRCQRCLSV